MAESITSCERQPIFGDLLGFVERRIAVDTSPYRQVVGEATQVARTNIKTGYPGQTGKINLLPTGNLLNPLLFLRFAPSVIDCSIALTS